MRRDRDKQTPRNGLRSRILARQLADEVLRKVSGGCTWVVPNGGKPHMDHHEL